MDKTNKKFVVYVATNIANGYRYVGFTSVGLERRKKQHLRRAKSGEMACPKFHNAIRKYGKNSFTWSIVATFETASEAFAEEIRLISELNPEYNVTEGGEGTLGVPSWNRKSVTCLEDGNIFVSIAHAANFYKMHVTTIHDVCSGKYRSANDLHFIFGDKIYLKNERLFLIKKIEKICAQRRKKVSVNKNSDGIKNGKDNKGRKATGPMRMSRKVRCLDDGKIYPSASEAGRQYNVAKSAIIELCLGKNGRKTVGGLRFKYEEV